MKYDLDNLNKIPILQVAEKLGLKVIRKTSSCFLHDEKSPSLKFNTNKNYWKCFGCGEGGSVIDLVCKKTGLTFPEACKWLSNDFQIGKIYSTRSASKNDSSNNLIVSIKKNEFKADTEVYKWIINNCVLDQEAKDYLINRRKFTIETILKFQIKSLNLDQNFYVDCVNRWGIERLLKCGIVKQFKNKHNDEKFCGLIWWTKTILFPFFNRSGEIIYLQGRNIDESHKIRYINLEGVETTLFNQPVLEELNKNDVLVICEGVTDCISSCIMSRPAVGVIGATGFKAEYVKLLKDYNIIVIPDNDKAGLTFANKIKKLFYKIGKEVKIVKLDHEYKDINDFYSKKYIKK